MGGLSIESGLVSKSRRFAAQANAMAADLQHILVLAAACEMIEAVRQLRVRPRRSPGA